MSYIAIILSAAAIIVTIVQWNHNKQIDSSRQVCASVINGWYKALEVIANKDTLSRINWIAAGRIIGYCQTLTKGITSTQDLHALKIELMVFREKAYPLLEIQSSFYYGNRLNQLADAAARAKKESSEISEKDIYALWNLIKYDDDVNKYYSDNTFSEEQIRKLPKGSRQYIEHLHSRNS